MVPKGFIGIFWGGQERVNLFGLRSGLLWT